MQHRRSSLRSRTGRLYRSAEQPVRASASRHPCRCRGTTRSRPRCAPQMPMPSATGTQCAYSPVTCVMISLATTKAMMNNPIPGTALKLRMQMDSLQEKRWSGDVACHPQSLSSPAVPCTIVRLDLMAERVDEVAEHVVPRPAQAGFVDAGEGSEDQGD